jgi:hypothetical protein
MQQGNSGRYHDRRCRRSQAIVIQPESQCAIRHPFDDPFSGMPVAKQGRMIGGRHKSRTVSIIRWLCATN